MSDKTLGRDFHIEQHMSGFKAVSLHGKPSVEVSHLLREAAAYLEANPDETLWTLDYDPHPSYGSATLTMFVKLRVKA